MPLIFCPLFPGKGAALTTLGPSKSQSAMANRDHCPSCSHVQPCKPQKSQLEQLSGTKMKLCLSFHLLKHYHQILAVTFYIFALLLIPQEYNSAPRNSNTSTKSCSANSGRGKFQMFFLDDMQDLMDKRTKQF